MFFLRRRGRDWALPSPAPAGPPTAEAQAKAWQRLRASLSSRQLQTISLHGFFEVRGSTSGKTYRIYTNSGYSMNVRVTNPFGRESRSYCLYCKGATHAHSIPLADHLLAQALLLRTDERLFLAIAR
jgi:hypothetical protein